MFQQGMKVSIVRKTFTQRQRKKSDYGAGEWIMEKGKDKTVEGVIASLDRLYLPLALSGKEVKSLLYQDLKFLSGQRASFESKLPDRHRIVDGVERNIIGKVVRITGKLLLLRLHIPVLINEELINIPYEEITFLKEKK